MGLVVVLMEWVDEYTCKCVKGYSGAKLVAIGVGLGCGEFGMGVVVLVEWLDAYTYRCVKCYSGAKLVVMGYGGCW